MTNFKKTFTKPHTILPVIHVTGQEQALRNTQIAREAQTDGVCVR